MTNNYIVNYLLFFTYRSSLVTTFAPDFKQLLFNLNKTYQEMTYIKLHITVELPCQQGNASWRIHLM